MRESDYLPLLQLALSEDLGELGDVTSQAVVPDAERSATLWSKDEGVLAGEEVFTAVFRAVDSGTRVEFALHDGAGLKNGQRVAEVRGKALAILSAERTGLNFISFLSGIATATRSLVESARASGRAVILDTRKTLPGWRALSKYAVTVGGGRNHRQGLYDMVLIKDNHVDSAGSVEEAVRLVRREMGEKVPHRSGMPHSRRGHCRPCRGRGHDHAGQHGGRGHPAARCGGSPAGRTVEASGTMTPGRVPAVSAAGGGLHFRGGHHALGEIASISR